MHAVALETYIQIYAYSSYLHTYPGDGTYSVQLHSREAYRRVQLHSRRTYKHMRTVGIYIRTRETVHIACSCTQERHTDACSCTRDVRTNICIQMPLYVGGVLINIRVCLYVNVADRCTYTRQIYAYVLTYISDSNVNIFFN